jgi:hypothetical protein
MSFLSELTIKSLIKEEPGDDYGHDHEEKINSSDLTKKRDASK